MRCRREVLVAWPRGQRTLGGPRLRAGGPACRIEGGSRVGCAGQGSIEGACLPGCD